MHVHVLAVFLVLLSLAGCATASSQAVHACKNAPVCRNGRMPRGNRDPSGVTLDDGITPDEAWPSPCGNNADFECSWRSSVSAARNLLEADCCGIRSCPALSGRPKAVGGHAAMAGRGVVGAAEAVAAARCAVDRVAIGLEQSGSISSQIVKIAYADLALARDRALLAEAAASELDQIRG